MTDLLPHHPARARPYPYSDEEIQRLLDAALGLSPRGSLRPWTYYCLLGLLSVSGLRFGEACNLQLQDLDLKDSMLTVRGAKFGKSRLVPLHRSTCKVLAAYLRRRKRLLSGHSLSSHLFVTLRGNRLDEAAAHKTFIALSKQIGLRALEDRHGPRIHDLRHRFATRTLAHWYHCGEEPERRLPLLSTYLGHVHVSDTCWYLNQWPELMREGMKRLERRWEARP